MMHTIYRPGQWSALVVPGALVALPSDAPQALITTLWDRLNTERTLAVVVDAPVAPRPITSFRETARGRRDCG